jgi:hypothetical protein
MSFIDQLRDSLERRLATLSEEIAALEAARNELARPSRRGRALGSASTRRAAGATRRLSTALDRFPGAAAARPSARSLAAAGGASGTAPSGGQARSSAGRDGSGSAVRRPSAPRARRLSAAELSARVEELLRESPSGASLVALAKRAGASEARVREVLHALDRADRARSSGSGRTSLWRLVDEEQLIAERAAELERLSSAARAGSGASSPATRAEPSASSPADAERAAERLSSTADAV